MYNNPNEPNNPTPPSAPAWPTRPDKTTRDSWHTLPMPAQNVTFTFERDLSYVDYEILQRGHFPENMEDKWFTYFENNQLHIFRSWTGFCIYIVSMMPGERIMRVTANRDPNQYKITNIAEDKLLLNNLLDLLIRFDGLKRNAEVLAAEKARKEKQANAEQENLQKIIDYNKIQRLN